MGQLLVIQDADEQRKRAILSRSRSLFEQLCGLEAHDELVSGDIAVLKFPRMVRGSTAIARHATRGAWVAGAGTWFLDGRDPQDALGELARLVCEEGRKAADCLADLDGAFVLVFGHPRSPVLTVVTDRVGTIHAYQTMIGSTLLISTSSLVLAALAESEWDQAACAEFLATGTVFEDRTLFRGIHKLEPATAYEYRGGKTTSKSRFWDLAEIAWNKANPVGTVQLLAESLQVGLRTVARTYERPVMDLTGGFDSRALLGAMLATGLHFDTVVNGAPDHPDVSTANALGRRFELSHRHQPLPQDWPQHWWSNAKQSLPLCDGEYDLLEYGRILENHRRLAQDFDISVNGSGGEFCKGYWWELLLPFIGSRKGFDARRLAAARFATDRWSAGLLAGEEADAAHFAEVIERANRGLENHPNTARMDNVYLTLRMQRWQGRIASATNRIWPCISPFMFRKPMEIAFAAPPRTRVRNRMPRRLIEYFDPELSRIPLAQGYPAQPLRPGTAHLFLPLAGEYLGKAWKKIMPKLLRRKPTGDPSGGAMTKLIAHEDEIGDLLTPARMATRELYEPRGLESFLTAARKGRANDQHVGRVVTLEYLARTLREAERG